MAIAFANATSVGDSSATGTSSAITVPSSTANGDLLIVVANIGTTVTFTAPGGWNQVITPTNDSTDSAYGIWWRIAASEPASYTWNFSVATHRVISMSRFTGTDSVSPIRTTSFKENRATGTTITGNALTGVTATDMTVRVGLGGNDAAATGNTFTAPAGSWTTAVNASTGTGYKGHVVSCQLGSQTPPTFTASSASWVWVEIGFAVIAAAAAAAPPKGGFFPFM